MKKSLLFSAMTLLISTAGIAQNLLVKHERTLTLPLGYVCYRTAGPLKIDGKLNEASW